VHVTLVSHFQGGITSKTLLIHGFVAGMNAALAYNLVVGSRLPSVSPPWHVKIRFHPLLRIGRTRQAALLHHRVAVVVATLGVRQRLGLVPRGQHLAIRTCEPCFSACGR
jgi:hypothetical protein